MVESVLPDRSSRFGARVRARLRTEQVIWFTTVADDGTPQPNPVWFAWSDDEFLIYNRPGARRLAYLRARPRVVLHFDGDGRGGDIVVFAGQARVVEDAPAADAVAEYVKKYRGGMTRVSGDPEAFGRVYSVAVRVRVTHVRGH